MRQVVCELAAILVGVLLAALPSVAATDLPVVDLDNSVNNLAPSDGESIGVKLPLQINGGLSYGTVTESSIARAQADAEADRLAKERANPISFLMTVPFQANEDFGYGPSHNGYRFTLNIQPVIPVAISKDWNLILRTILPVISQHDLFYVENLPKSFPLQQNRSQDGFGDTTQSFFFSPSFSGPFGLLWGIGPAFLYPTGTGDLLGTGTFSLGPTVVLVNQTGPWTTGVLMNQLWSVVIEEHRSSVSQMFLQPFVAYTTKTHTTFTLSSESTANWNNPTGQAKWTVPLIFQISQILKIGRQPVSIQIGGKYYVDSPRYGPDWGLRLTFTLLYPRAARGIPIAEANSISRTTMAYEVLESE